MSQFSLSSDASLLVRDGRGRYLPASADQILDAARRVIDQKMRRGAEFSSPETVKEYLRTKLADAVDAGLDRLVIDFGEVKSADVTLIKLGLSVMQLAKELSMKYSMIGSEAVSQECKHYEETKDWRFVGSFKEAVESLNGQALAA